MHEFEATGADNKKCEPEPPVLALAEIYDGRSLRDAARMGGMTLQIVGDWVVRFNTQEPLVERCSLG